VQIEQRIAVDMDASPSATAEADAPPAPPVAGAGNDAGRVVKGNPADVAAAGSKPLNKTIVAALFFCLFFNSLTLTMPFPFIGFMVGRGARAHARYR
jgi:hypothetical protein